MAFAHDLQFPLEPAQIGGSVAYGGPTFLLVTKGHIELGVHLGEDALVDGRHLLTDHGESNAKLTSLATDVAKDATEFDPLGIEHAGGFLYDDVYEWQLIWGRKGLAFFIG